MIAPSCPAVVTGYRNGDVYYLPHGVSPASTILTSTSKSDSSLLGDHFRLNHMRLTPLKRLLKLHGIIPKMINEIEFQKCNVCVQGKMHCLPFQSRSRHCATSPGAEVHLDFGSFKDVSWEGCKYFIMFVDHCSKAVTVYTIKSKYVSFNCFKLFCALFEKEKWHVIFS